MRSAAGRYLTGIGGPMDESNSKDDGQKHGKPGSQQEKSRCVVCGTTSDEEMLLKGERDGKPADVCVRCLPRLIHGQH